MYSLKPILINQNIELPQSMYKLKPVNVELSENMQNSINNSGNSELDLLAQRQGRVLDKLADLKQILIAMRGELKLCAKPAQPPQKSSTTSKAVKKPLDLTILTDVVVNAHPAKVPFSILALKNLWKGRLNLSVDVFTHSSVKESEVSKSAKDFVEKVSLPIEQNSLPTLKVTLIWKDIEIAQMVTSPSALPVFGEVNIIRYLSRVGPNEFSYEADNQIANQTDSILDICHQLSNRNSTKERQQSVQQLSQRLGKGQFFNESSDFSVADIAVSSTLKQLNAKEVPANLANWLQKVSQIAGY